MNYVDLIEKQAFSMPNLSNISNGIAQAPKNYFNSITGKNINNLRGNISDLQQQQSNLNNAKRYAQELTSIDRDRSNAINQYKKNLADVNKANKLYNDSAKYTNAYMSMRNQANELSRKKGGVTGRIANRKINKINHNAESLLNDGTDLRRKARDIESKAYEGLSINKKNFSNLNKQKADVLKDFNNASKNLEGMSFDGMNSRDKLRTIADAIKKNDSDLTGAQSQLSKAVRNRNLAIGGTAALAGAGAAAAYGLYRRNKRRREQEAMNNG